MSWRNFVRKELKFLNAKFLTHNSDIRLLTNRVAALEERERTREQIKAWMDAAPSIELLPLIEGDGTRVGYGVMVNRALVASVDVAGQPIVDWGVSTEPIVDDETAKKIARDLADERRSVG